MMLHVCICVYIYSYICCFFLQLHRPQYQTVGRVLQSALLLVSFWFSDAPCPDDENNCANNSYCYIYSVTGRPYCAQSCELNNGGCGMDQQCEMVTVQCFTDPCPPIVQCTPTSELIVMIVCYHTYVHIPTTIL